MTSGQATATYCTATGTGCDALQTGNYKTGYPYIETELPSAIHIPGGGTVTMPTVTAQFKATGAVGAVEPVDLTEFKVNTNVEHGRQRHVRRLPDQQQQRQWHAPLPGTHPTVDDHYRFALLCARHHLGKQRHLHRGWARAPSP